MLVPFALHNYAYREYSFLQTGITNSYSEMACALISFLLSPFSESALMSFKNWAYHRLEFDASSISVIICTFIISKLDWRK
jgi:hypothetical protein